MTAVVHALSLFGPLSVPTLALLADFIARRLFRRTLIPQPDRAWLVGFMLLGGVVLYALVCFAVPFTIDIYHAGFSNWPVVALALLGALAAARRPALAIVALSIIAACKLHLFRSNNLFDYAIDPVGTLAAISVSIRVAIASVAQALAPSVVPEPALDSLANE